MSTLDLAPRFTRDQLASALTERFPLNSTQSREVVDLMIQELAKALAQGQPVELRGLGSFHIRQTKPKPGRNPMKPDQQVLIPARWSIKFRPGKDVKAALLAKPINKVADVLPEAKSGANA